LGHVKLVLNLYAVPLLIYHVKLILWYPLDPEKGKVWF
jgi:hypothetical protein